jgi:predicted CopG family antitoxin
MTKQIGISDEVYQKLKDMKRGDHDSFTKVIKSLLKEDTRLNEINECFERLKLLIPNLKHSTELIRVVWVRFYRSSHSKQEMTIKEIDSLIEMVSKEAINLIGEIK